MSLLLLLDGGGPPSAYPTVNSPGYIDDHTATALSQLLQEFHDSELINALLASYTDQVQETENLIDPLVLARDLAVAVGNPLDSLGEAVGEPRQGRTDDVYRLFIRAKILVNKSSGTGDELITIVRQMAGEPLLGVDLDEYDPATVWIRPVDDIMLDDPALWAVLLRLAKAAGVRLLFIYNESAESAMFQYAGTAGMIGTGRGFDQGHLAGDA